MRLATGLAVLFAAAVAGEFGAFAAAQPATKEVPTPAGKDTPAAELTRTKLLKVKVTVSFRNVALREAFKEFAAQVDMASERPILWTYAEGVPAEVKVTYTCSAKPLEAALDELFKTHGLGYVVLSLDDQPRDGWVRVTKGDERGRAAVVVPSTVDDDDEKKAAGRLALAKELIEKGKPADAKLMLMLVTTKFAKTKAAAEAKLVLEKLDK